MIETTEQYDLPPALLRQRRNLMVVSLIILFIVFAGAKLKSISLLGIQMTFENPQVVLLFLKVFLIYFLYRYYLYIVQEPSLYLKNTYYKKLHTLTESKIQKIKDDLFPSVTDHRGEYDFRQMTKTGLFTREVTAVVEKSNTLSLINGTFEINILPFFWDSIKAFLYTAFNRTYATDYLLPFVVGISALVTGLQYNG